MNYEKKYKEALERAQQAVDKGQVSQNFVDEIFPELKESEDERIRLEIRNFIWGYPDKLPKRDKWLAWFEKQKGKEDIPIVQSIETKQPKYIDADEVFKWIMTNLSHYGNAMLAGKFKEDFEL